MDIEPTFKGYIEDEQDALLIIQATMDGKLKHIPRRPYEIERSYLISSGNIFVFVEEISGIKRWTDGVTWSPSRITGKFLIYKELEKSSAYNKNKLKTLTKKHDHNKSKTKNKKSLIQTADHTNDELVHKPRIKLPPLVTKSGDHSNSQSRLDSMHTTPNSTSSDSNDDFNNEANTSESTSQGGISPDLSKPASLRSIHPMKYTGLIKKTISVSLKRALLNHTETFHIISYYTIDDVKDNRLITPKDSLVFRNIKPTEELAIAMENTKLGNTKAMAKGGTNSLSSSSTPRQMMEHTPINGINYTQQTQQPPHFYNNGLPDPNSMIPTNTTLNNSSQSINSNTSSGTVMNSRNNLKNQEFNVSTPSLSNNTIPPVPPLYNGNGVNSNNLNSNINVNNGLPSQSPNLQGNRIPIPQNSYYNNQALPYSGNMPYLNSGSNNSNSFNNGNNNAEYSHSVTSQLPPRSNTQGTYQYYYQGQTSGNAHGFSDNNGTAPAGQVIPPLSSAFYSSSDTSNSNTNTGGSGVPPQNTSGTMMPPVQNNGTYTLYPLNASSGSNNQVSSTSTTGPNNISNCSSLNSSTNNNNSNNGYYNNTAPYSRPSINPAFSNNSNATNGNVSNGRNDTSLGNMIPTPVSLRGKNLASSSYISGYSNENSNNNGSAYPSMSTNSSQMGAQYVNQINTTTSNSNSTKSDAISYNSQGPYVSNIYTYPGSQQPQN